MHLCALARIIIMWNSLITLSHLIKKETLKPSNYLPVLLLAALTDVPLVAPALHASAVSRGRNKIIK